MKKKVCISSFVTVASAGECDLQFVPPMTRRRFSPLQRVVFSLLGVVAPKGCEPKIVFASRDGEVKLTRDLVEAFKSDRTVSPWKFSSSVYNAAPGLYSVFAGNRSTYTAIAAGDETVENSLVEAVFESGGAVWCYAEETDGGYGIAVRFGEDAIDGVSARASRKIEIGVGDGARKPISFSEAVDFFSGKSEILSGRWITLKNME